MGDQLHPMRKFAKRISEWGEHFHSFHWIGSWLTSQWSVIVSGVIAPVAKMRTSSPSPGSKLGKVMMALFTRGQSIERMERELADARSKLVALRAKQVASEHGAAVTRRGVLSLSDHQVDEGKATKTDRDVREDHLSALATTIAEQETTVAELTALLAEAKRALAEDKAREAEAHAVALERALGNLKPVMIEFTDVCRAAGAVISEPMGMGRTLTDILRHVESDTAYYSELLRQRARALRQPPPAPTAPKMVNSNSPPQ